MIAATFIHSLVSLLKKKVFALTECKDNYASDVQSILPARCKAHSPRQLQYIIVFSLNVAFSIMSLFAGWRAEFCTVSLVV